ncbi:hypothetical protein KM043_008736 [Ampulex compressa]|nr:hypothetical protein KM043_008736 [Ampulex compressa]
MYPRRVAAPPCTPEDAAPRRARGPMGCYRRESKCRPAVVLRTTPLPTSYGQKGVSEMDEQPGYREVDPEGPFVQPATADVVVGDDGDGDYDGVPVILGARRVACSRIGTGGKRKKKAKRRGKRRIQQPFCQAGSSFVFCVVMEITGEKPGEGGPRGEGESKRMANQRQEGRRKEGEEHRRRLVEE